MITKNQSLAWMIMSPNYIIISSQLQYSYQLSIWVVLNWLLILPLNYLIWNLYNSKILLWLWMCRPKYIPSRSNNIRWSRMSIKQGKKNLKHEQLTKKKKKEQINWRWRFSVELRINWETIFETIAKPSAIHVQCLYDIYSDSFI